MDNKVYAIVDLNGYVEQVREAAAYSISEDSEYDDLENYISLNQIINMVNQECIGFDDNGCPLLDENKNEQIFEAVVIWIHNVALARLAGNDLIECAWDSDINDMVFWNKETIINAKQRESKKSN